MSETSTSTKINRSGSLTESPYDAALGTPEHSWLVSLSFWATLLLAAAVYACVALSPKFCVWNRVRLQQQRNAEHLSALESEVAFLERVEKALETDPEFRQRAAGASSLKDVGSEFIPVSGDLLFGHQTSPTVTAPAPVEVSLYHQTAETIATDQRLRTMLLITTTLLIFFAFAVLNDAGTHFVVAGKQVIQTAAAWPFRRYLTKAENNPSHSPHKTELNSAESKTDKTAWGKKDLRRRLFDASEQDEV